MRDKVGGVGREIVDDIGEGMHCIDHPYRNNRGGVCAYCLQEKLRKLVSSSKSSDPFFSPTFLPSSDFPVSASSLAKKNKPIASANSTAGDIVLRRNKSDASYRARKKSFWSFLTLSYTSFAFSAALPSSVSAKRRSISSASSSVAGAVKKGNRTPRREQNKAVTSSASAIGDGDISPSGSQASSSFGRKVARSRSVGCGSRSRSRSFSGDFLERISTGLGDCALRRVESQRETKPKASVNRREQGIKEQFKDSLSTISSSTHWLHAASAVDAFNERSGGGALHGVSKSWAWAFAGPIRAFRLIGKRDQAAVIAAGSASHGARSGGAILPC